MKKELYSDLFRSKTLDGKDFRDVSFTESSLSSFDSNLDEEEIKKKADKADDEE